MKAKTDIYQEYTDLVLALLEGGKIPWIKAWKDGNNADPSMPHNATTGRAYNGINVLLLLSQPYDSNAWLTYKQAMKLGGNVIKGEKSTGITFWNFLKSKDKEGKESTFPLLRGYRVFNIEQCEGLEGGSEGVGATRGQLY